MSKYLIEAYGRSFRLKLNLETRRQGVELITNGGQLFLPKGQKGTIGIVEGKRLLLTFYYNPTGVMGNGDELNYWLNIDLVGSHIDYIP